MPVGYSGKPTWQKLGFPSGIRVLVEGYRGDYGALVEQPDLVLTAERPDHAHLFVTERAALEEAIPRVFALLPERGAVWVSWPKKASGVPTDMSEDTIRAVVLPQGMVDVKVCAIDATWSGLKVVRRRGGASRG